MAEKRQNPKSEIALHPPNNQIRLSLIKGSTINHLGGGRGADFRERNFFFSATLRTKFFFFGDPLNQIFIFLPKLTEEIFFF